MNFRKTLFWAVIAAGLFGFIYVAQWRGRQQVPAPAVVLPHLDPSAITSISVRPAGQLEIRADRTNQAWTLTAPLHYPAQALSIEQLIAALRALTPATYLSAEELRARPNADEEYGFSSPLASIVIQQPNYRLHLLVGSKTAPGDQAFLQVVGEEGACVVASDFLRLLPKAPNDWRDTAILDLAEAPIDRVSVTNTQRSFELRRDTNRLWRIAWPSQTRGDNAKIDGFLASLQTLRAAQFISDDPKPDLERFGLQPPELEITLAHGSNTLALLQFGKAVTNRTELVYARCGGKPGVFAVATDLIRPWQESSLDDLRDSHLLTINTSITAIEVRADEAFSLVRQTNAAWKVMPQAMPADSQLVDDMVATLSRMKIVQFVKDVVAPPDLPQYGLATPTRAFVLRASGPGTNGAGTNEVVAEIDFGAVKEGKLFVRRTDETSVYAVSTNELERLPSFSWQMRDRQVCSLNESNVVSISIRQDGRTRQVRHDGPHKWSLVKGSQGVINDLAVEETVRALCNLRAGSWIERNPKDPARYGFSEADHRVALELKDGNRISYEFGGETLTGWICAKTEIDGASFVFEFPWPVYRDVASYLCAPAIP